jgi:septum formation protein
MKASIKQAKLILASRSPRRRYLLRQAGLSFEVLPSSFDESSIHMEDPATYVRVLAESKARDVSVRFPDAWVIGADTVVVIDGTILGKPASRDQARSMLTRLSARVHQVLTGYCIRCEDANRSFSETISTNVEFKSLSAGEIDWYIRSGEPFDKAGAYAIQGLGTFLVKGIHGSYTSVVGLPVCEVLEFLIQEDIVGLTIDE